MSRQPCGFGSRPWAPLVGDDDERRDRLDLELLDQLGVVVGIDANELESVVIGAPLENLCEEPLDATAAPRRRGVEEDQARLRGDGFARGCDHCPALQASAAVTCDGSGVRSARASWRVA